MKEHVFRLKYGDDLKQSIYNYCQEHQIASGCVVCGVGCVYKVALRKANGQDLFFDNKHYEIVSLMGTIASNGLHLHISLSDNDLNTIGGHLVDGCLVNTTAEIVILELDNYKLNRVFDASTGYNELEIEEV